MPRRSRRRTRTRTKKRSRTRKTRTKPKFSYRFGSDPGYSSSSSSSSEDDNNGHRLARAISRQQRNRRKVRTVKSKAKPEWLMHIDAASGPDERFTSSRWSDVEEARREFGRPPVTLETDIYSQPSQVFYSSAPNIPMTYHPDLAQRSSYLLMPDYGSTSESG